MKTLYRTCYRKYISFHLTSCNNFKDNFINIAAASTPAGSGKVHAVMMKQHKFVLSVNCLTLLELFFLLLLFLEKTIFRTTPPYSPVGTTTGVVSLTVAMQFSSQIKEFLLFQNMMLEWLRYVSLYLMYEH